MRTVVLFVLAAASLAACDRIENTIHQLRGELPSRKPGLWQVTVSRSYLTQPVVFRSCFDRHSDTQSPLFIRNKPPVCDHWSMVRRPDGSYVGDARCRGASAGLVISGDFASRFTVDDWRRLDRDEMQWRAGTVLKRHSVWVYKGACPTSIPPGQELRPDGKVVPIGAEVLH